MTPQFDTYLLHLPPINLHSIGLLYRSRSEYYDSLPQNSPKNTQEIAVFRSNKAEIAQRLIALRG